MAPQEASDFLGQRSTLFQIDEQRRASYTPAWPTEIIKKNHLPKEKLSRHLAMRFHLKIRNQHLDVRFHADFI